MAPLRADRNTVVRQMVLKRIRPHLKMSGASFRIDETYIKVGKTCKYLYRAVDKEGQTIHLRRSVNRFLALTPDSRRRTSAAAIPSVVSSPGTRPHCRAGASASTGR
ncbi:MAG: DDE-type integrase/transposase/recombinase [Pyrinomonadaceae bacterium]